MADMKALVRERNRAMWSLDEAKIKAYCRKYDVPIPEAPRAFWGGVYKAILGIPNSPEDVKAKAREGLRELRMSPFIWGCYRDE